MSYVTVIVHDVLIISHNVVYVAYTLIIFKVFDNKSNQPD